MPEQIISASGTQSPWVIKQGAGVTVPVDEADRVTYDSSSAAEYLGWGVPGANPGSAVWKIKKLINNSTGMFCSGVWASGNSNYDKIWNDRALYPYE